MTSVRPLAFGPPHAPRVGWLHAPDDGAARGAVVLCPALGAEALAAHWVYALLGEQLAARGFLALRFDYIGTGDSAGELDDVDGIETWIEDVESAVAVLKNSGAEHISLLGLRVGALLAARAAARRDDIDALVLWDPCDGRAFLREQKALALLSIGSLPARADGAVEIMSMVLPPRLAASLQSLRAEPCDRPLARQLLLLERPERPADSKLAAALAGQHVDRRPATGQRDLVDVEPGGARAPSEAMGAIVDWLAGRLPEARTPVTIRTGAGEPGGASHEIEVRVGDARLRERALTLEPEGIFAIVCEPERPVPNQPTVVFLNAGLIHHVGPGRMWVNLARRLGAAGIRSVRFDLDGIGDSRGDAAAREAYPVAALADIGLVLKRLAVPGPENAYLVGLCSGAYHAAEAGLAHGARGVCMINPAVYFDPGEVRNGGDVSDERAVAQKVNPVVRWLRSKDSVVRFSKWTPVARVRHSEALTTAVDAAHPLWSLLDRLGVYRSPVEVLEKLVAQDSDVLLICGQWEARPFVRWRGRTEALEDAGKLSFAVLEGSDHALFQSGCRIEAEDLIVEHLLAGMRPEPRPTERSGARARRSPSPARAGAPVRTHAAVRATLRERLPELRSQLPGLLAGRGLIGRFAYLVATQVVTVLLGLVYWMVVARLVPAPRVGVASTAMFSASLIAALGVLGMTSLVLVILGDLPRHDQRAVVSTTVLVAGTVTAAIALAVWGVSPVMGPSFQRLGADTTNALLFVLGTGVFTASSVLDAIAIGMRRGPVQLLRNVVYAVLKVSLVVVAVLLGARTTTGILVAWDAAMLISFPVVFRALRLHQGTAAPTWRDRLAVIRRYGTLSLRHHILNVAISAVGFFLPVVAAMFAAPRDMAYFSMAQLVAGSALLLPFLLTMSLFVESSGDEELLRRNLRRTLPVGLACAVFVIAVLEPGGGIVLGFFGHDYVTHGLFPLRVLLLGGLPYVAKDHFVAVRRAQERLGEAAKIGAISTLVEIAAASAGGALAGLDGLVLGWLAATVLEAMYFAPRVIEAMRVRPAPVAHLSPTLGEPVDKRPTYAEGGDLTA